jgi:hypothetical protein
MTETGSTSELIESRAARRLGRLFRIERVGCFERRPIETVWRLIRRRARLVDELIRLDSERRSQAAPGSVELGVAIGELAGEVDRSQRRCVDRISALAGELRRQQAGGIATGLRDGADGRLLGHG